MIKSKLLFLLKNLKNHPREILDFEKFVKSPYFNSKQEVVRLFYYIKKHWNASERQQSIKLTKELAFKNVFPKEPQFINWKILECISNLSLLLEHFFAFQELTKSKTRMNILLADGLKDRGIDKFYFKKVALLEKEFDDTSQGQDAGFYHKKMWLKEHVYYHPNHPKHLPKENEARLISMSDQLDHFYIIKKLKYICEVLTQHKIFGLNYSLGLHDEVLHYARTTCKDQPVIVAYLSIIQLFKTGNVEAILPLKQQLFKLIDKYEMPNNLDLLLKFLNALPPYSGRLQLYFEIYQFAVDKSLLIENGYISPDHFTNIIHIGCVLGEDEWVRNFKISNSKFLKLDQDNLENIDQLIDAYIYYFKGEYRDTFILLDQIKLKDITYGLRRYTLLFRTIIEGKDAIKFSFDIKKYRDNFKSYLKRKHQVSEISQSQRTGSLIFLEIVNKLYKNKKTDRQKLVALLESHDEIPHKDWLMRKIETWSA